LYLFIFHSWAIISMLLFNLICKSRTIGQSLYRNLIPRLLLLYLWMYFILYFILVNVLFSQINRLLILISIPWLIGYMLNNRPSPLILIFCISLVYPQYSFVAVFHSILSATPPLQFRFCFSLLMNLFLMVRGQIFWNDYDKIT